MAKEKNKKAGKAAKADKAPKASAGKLPKRIAGVKIPKELRDPGGKLMDALSHPLIADVAAAALLGAAAALRDDKTVRETAAEARKSAGKSLKKLGGEGSSLAALVADAAEAGLRKLKAVEVAPRPSKAKSAKRK